MQFDENKIYTSRDFDKLSETQFAAFSDFIEDAMNKAFTKKEIALIQKSDTISNRYLLGQPIVQAEADIVLAVEKLYKTKLNPNFLESTLNYYKNRTFKSNVNIN